MIIIIQRNPIILIQNLKSVREGGSHFNTILNNSHPSFTRECGFFNNITLSHLKEELFSLVYIGIGKIKHFTKNKLPVNN